MARYRTLKPETFADEKLSECSVPARFLFIGLWAFCDDMGRKAYSARRVQAEVFPADQDITVKLVDKWLHDLERVGVIRFYEVDGKQYIWIPRFLRHQRIDRPSHSYLPAHPDDPDPDCQCIACKIKRDEENAPRHYKPRIHKPTNGPNVPGDTRRLDEYSNTRRALDEDSICSVVECNVVELNQNQHQGQNQEQQQPQKQNPSLETNSENRRAQASALEEIATRMLDLLHLPRKPLILEALTKSIQVKARSKQCSLEAAAQQIAARAAFVAVEYPPEDWALWFQDVRYEYVPQGDKRLDDRRIEARPVCGGSRCSEGWEPVKTGEITVLRRCPDCAKLWSDLGM